MSDDPDINVSELVKSYLYQVATGTNSQQNVCQEIVEVIKAEFAKLPSMLVMQDGIVNTGYTVTNDDIDVDSPASWIDAGLIANCLIERITAGQASSYKSSDQDCNSLSIACLYISN